MRKLTFSVFVPFAFVGATSLVACSFSMQAGSDPQPPPPRPQQPATPAQTAAPAATPAKPIKSSGLRVHPQPQPSSSQTVPPAVPSNPPPTGAAIVTGSTIFGGSTVDPAGFKGSIFFVGNGLTAIPADLATQKPAGFLFTSTLNITPQAFTSGFPGVEPTRKENFAIRYEGPLVVGTESDYDFRVVAEDGAKLLIDGTPIVDNDGVKTAPAEKTAPVHLVIGTHVLTVDYLQTTGNVALQVFCKKSGGTEQVCPTKLP